MHEMMDNKENVCKCFHHHGLSLLVVLFGLLFLGGTAGWWSAEVVNWGWPVLVIAAGLYKFSVKWCKCC